VERWIYDGFEVLQACCVIFFVDARMYAEKLREGTVEYTDRNRLDNLNIAIGTNKSGKIAIVPVEVELMSKVGVDAIA
jgi:hypothetical protein